MCRGVNLKGGTSNMWSMLIAALIVGGLVIILIVERDWPVVTQVFAALLVFLLLLMSYRPTSVKENEKKEFVNNILKWYDQQRVVDKCRGCIYIKEYDNTCQKYMFPWEAWRAYKKCPDYKKVSIEENVRT